MRHIYFISFGLMLFILYLEPILELFRVSLSNGLYSHLPLIPVASLFLLFKRRKDIFSEVEYSFQAEVTVVVAGMLLYWIGQARIWDLNQNDHLSLMMFSLLICLIGGFISFYGRGAFRKAMFPLLFLIFFIPIPAMILDPLIKVLLIGSAESSYKIFKILGVPVYRDGFIFELPGIAVEVTRQCSGIRSFLALLITSVLAGHFILRTGWRRIVLVMAIFPIAIFKNSLRIVTISLLAAYADPIFLTNHWIHSAGGKPFFILALLFLLPVLWFLRRSEKKGELPISQPISQP